MLEGLIQFAIIIVAFVTIVFIVALLCTYGSYERTRSFFVRDFLDAKKYINSVSERLERMNKELEKTEKELSYIIENR